MTNPGICAILSLTTKRDGDRIMSINNRERKFHLWGWILFIVCAAFFIAASIKGDNTLTLIGSVIFLVACVVFLIPLVTGEDKNKNSGERINKE